MIYKPFIKYLAFRNRKNLSCQFLFVNYKCQPKNIYFILLEFYLLIAKTTLKGILESFNLFFIHFVFLGFAKNVRFSSPGSVQNSAPKILHFVIPTMKYWSLSPPPFKKSVKTY